MNRELKDLLVLVAAIQKRVSESILSIRLSGLEPDDIRACLAYAHLVIAHDSLAAIRVIGG